MTVLYLAAVVSAVGDADSEAMLEYSYQLCAPDGLCAQRWFVSEAPSSPLSKETFRVLLISWKRRTGAVFSPDLDACRYNLLTNATCDSLRAVWVVAMRSANHCPGPNEQFLLTKGCVCPAGANCYTRQSASFVDGMTGLNWFMGVAVALIIVVQLLSNRRSKAVRIDSTKNRLVMQAQTQH